MFSRNILTTIFICFSIIVFNLFILNSSLNKGTPARDSGIFLYIGNQIVNGKLPYRDLWEHKPPMIFYINALGVSIGTPPQLWGIWFIEFANLLTCSLISFFLLKKVWGIFPSIIGTVISLLYVSTYFQGGNQIEEYGLALQFIILLLFFLAETRTQIYRYYFFIGIFTGFVFLLRQNLISVSLAILTYLVFQKEVLINFKTISRKILSFSIGFVFINTIFLIYFIQNEIFFDYIDQAFFYNFLYTNVGWDKKLLVITNFIHLWPYLTITILSGFLINLLILLRRRKMDPHQLILTRLGVIIFPITLYLITLSGRPYNHYYIPLLLFVALYTAQLAYWFLKLSEKIHQLSKPFAILTVIGIFVIANYEQIELLVQKNLEKKIMGKNLQIRWFYFNNFEEHKNTIEFIKRQTNADDSILIWGSEPSINFVTEHSAPSRYFNQFSLFTKGYSDEFKFTELINDLNTKRPKIIIDASTSTAGQSVDNHVVVPPINPEKRKQWIKDTGYIFDGMDTLFAYIDAHYEYTGSIELYHWEIYQLKK